jgi:hypothetical protein
MKKNAGRPRNWLQWQPYREARRISARQRRDGVQKVTAQEVRKKQLWDPREV